MSRRGKAAALALLVTTAAAVLTVGDASACSVCFGNPDAPMVKGVQKGVLVLVGCVGTVLSLFASMFLYWVWRVHSRGQVNNGVLTR